MYMNEKLLTIEETAELIKVKPGTIQNWLTRGQCPFQVYKLETGAIRVKETDLQTWMNGLATHKGCKSCSQSVAHADHGLDE
jgi:excisionase family DNA binding protein